MKLYHVSVEQEDNWHIGRILERDGVTTQGRSLDELVFMLRDAIELMWNEKDVQLELILPGKVRPSTKKGRPKNTAKSLRRMGSPVAAS